MRLTLTLTPTDDGVAIRHAVTAELDRHVHTEFVRLRDLLRGRAGG